MAAMTASGPAMSATATANLGVSLTVTNQCTVGGGTLAFGSTGLIDANIDATGTFTVRCNRGMVYNVSLGAGNGVGATTSVRKMTGPGGATVDYSLYTNAGRTTNWGDGNIAATPSEYTAANSAAATYTVYGRVAPQDTPPAGAYADSVLITVTY